MENTREIVDELEGYTSWLKTLKKHDKNIFFKPVKEGKWSVAEIISHIMFWDRYIVEETLPKMKEGADVESIEFQLLNDKASAYALSGVAMLDLIDEAKQSREKLVAELRNKSEDQFFEKFTLNGEEIDEYSGFPHTLYNYVCSFIWHDNHHKEQVEALLNEIHN